MEGYEQDGWSKGGCVVVAGQETSPAMWRLVRNKRPERPQIVEILNIWGVDVFLKASRDSASAGFLAHYLEFF